MPRREPLEQACPTIPLDKALDSTPTLLSEGYEFISDRRKRHRSDVLQTRLMLRTAICVRGKEAAELVYDAERFTRKQALPKPALGLLLHKGNVNLLDDAAQRHRFRGTCVRTLTGARLPE